MKPKRPELTLDKLLSLCWCVSKGLGAELRKMSKDDIFYVAQAFTKMGFTRRPGKVKDKDFSVFLYTIFPKTKYDYFAGEWWTIDLHNELGKMLCVAEDYCLSNGLTFDIITIALRLFYGWTIEKACQKKE